MDKALFTFEEILQATGGTSVGEKKTGVSVCSVSTDTRKPMPGALFIALRGESFDAHAFLANAVERGAAVLCVEKSSGAPLPPGIPIVAVDSTEKAYQDLARFHRMRFPALRVAALTGSCGKTSTKEALRAIFNHVYGNDHVLATEGNTNNQVGVPANLLKLEQRHKIAVLEAGTSHFGEIEPLARCIRPDHAMIVSIRSSHIENLGSLEGIASEKSHIFGELPTNGGGVIPFRCAGNDILREALKGHRILTFGTEEEADYRAEYLGGNLRGASFRLIRKETGETAEVNWSVPGEHQAVNAAGAAALASFFGISLADAAEGLKGTTLPGMRMRIAEHGGATWINDAYNANPDSMKASLLWLKEFADASRLVLVLGDMGEQGDRAPEAHADVIRFARDNFPAARIVAVGPMMSEAGKGIADSSFASSAEAKNLPVKPGDLVFLKASRSTRLELVEPEN